MSEDNRYKKISKINVFADQQARDILLNRRFVHCHRPIITMVTVTLL
jgi:hypothetical protein